MGTEAGAPVFSSIRLFRNGIRFVLVILMLLRWTVIKNTFQGSDAQSTV